MRSSLLLRQPRCACEQRPSRPSHPAFAFSISFRHLLSGTHTGGFSKGWVEELCPFWQKSKQTLWTYSENNLFVLFFSRLFRPNICENIRGDLADPFGLAYSSGDQTVTSFVSCFVFWCGKVCLFICFRFSAAKMACWQRRTLPKRRISKVTSTPWSSNIDKTKFDPCLFDSKFGVASF